MPETQELPLEERFANYAAEAYPEETAPDPQAPEPESAPKTAAPEKPEPATEPESEQADEQPFEYATVNELADAIGVPVDKLLTLKANTKVDDQEGEYTLSDIIKGFQLDQHNQNKSKSLSEAQARADQLRQDYEAKTQASQQYLQQLDSLGRYAQEMLNIDVNTFNSDPQIQELRYTNPTEYMMQKDALQTRQAQINAFLGQVNQQNQHQQAQAKERQQAQVQETLTNRAKIRSEWTDEAVFNKDATAIRDAFLSHGFKAEELPTLLTSPAYLAAADAATRWWNLQKQKPEVTQRVRTAPKLVIGAARADKSKGAKYKDLMAQVAANPKDSDLAAEAFSALVKEGNL